MTQSENTAMLTDSMYAALPEQARPLVYALNRKGIRTQGSWDNPLRITMDSEYVTPEQLETLLADYPNKRFWDINARQNWSRGDSIYVCTVLGTSAGTEEIQNLATFLQP